MENPEDLAVIEFVNTYAENDAICRCQLRPWMIYQLDHQTFPGVEWLDEEKTHFKIPWTSQGQPNWFEDSKIFLVSFDMYVVI